MIVALGVLVRGLVMLAYRPALFFSDSWAYLSTAFGHHLVSLPYLRPVGYAVLLRLLLAAGHDITVVVALQHLAGLAIGMLVYVLLVRGGVGPMISAAGAALVLLDGYAITLEQYVMPDTFFTLTLMASAAMLAWWSVPAGGGPPLGAGRAVFAGLLLAAAALQREVGLFAIPVALVFLLWVRSSWKAVLSCIVAAALPLGAYAGIMEAKTGVFGLTATSGWTLYSRVAGFADCPMAGLPLVDHGLCETPRERATHPRVPDWYMWDARSPAIRLFHRSNESHRERAVANRLLGTFARVVIVNQPGAFLDAVGADFLRYFTPGATPYADAVSATSLPRLGAREVVNDAIRDRVLPGTRPRVVSPAAVLRGYRALIHVPRPVLALLAIASLLGCVVRTPSRHVALLFGGTAVVLLLGTSATAGFGLRYMMPAVPLLAVGGGLALRDLGARVSRRWRTSSGPAG